MPARILSLSLQTRRLLSIGFGGLLVLLFALGSSAVLFLYSIEVRQDRIRQQYVDRDRTLERLRSSIYLSGTYVRDYLFDRTEPPAPLHRVQFEETASQVRELLQEAGSQFPPNSVGFESLQQEAGRYLAQISQVFAWPETRRAASYEFVQTELLPGRMRVLNLVDGVLRTSEHELEMNSQAVAVSLSSFRLRLIVLTGFALLVGGLLAGVTLRRILRLEREASATLQQATKAREELTRLSADLVAAQETERKNISRELHDEVGQTLYAAMLSLGNLRSSLLASRPEEGLREWQIANELTERTATSVRNMALLLRPAMLDDLGLVPALSWLSRESTRTQTIPVEVSAEDVPEELPDDHATCVYRIVQESIHNAQKHSHARVIRVDLKASGADLTVRISDDGRGFDSGQHAGLGILGMRERAIRLGGSVTIQSEPGRGAAVFLSLPIPQEISPLRTA